MDFATEVVADFAVILAVAGLMTYIFHKIKQPLILGYLIAGIIIGPYTPPFSLINRPEVLDASAELGVLLLLFGIGLAFPLSKLRKIGLKTYAVISIIELVLMFAFSYLAGIIMHWTPLDCLFLGAALGSSSTVVIAKVLTDMGKMEETSTMLMMGILVIEDLAVVLILSLLTTIVSAESLTALTLTWTIGKIILFIFGSLIIGLALIPRMIDRVHHSEHGEGHTEHDEVIVLTVLGFCFGLAVIANLVGLSMAIGAFMMGVIIAEAKSGKRIIYLTSRIKEMFGALFFVSVGALIDITQFKEFIVPALIIIIIMLLGKTLGCGIGTKLMGYDLSTSLKVGLGMGQIGEFAFIVAKAGQDLGAVSPFLFPTIGVAVAVTTFLTPYLIKLSYSIDANKLFRQSPEITN